ncbi:MAG: NAD(P)H-dependent oxidoreductase [Verrucomicrobia bacterium]|nr:NAD(P)H-dependent oxidoreductase [Verrucomicrobiota bacterium]
MLQVLKALSCLTIAGISFAALLMPAGASAATHPDSLFARTNLVAWCIVPFDAKKRGPEERAAMLERLGIRRLAYDYRAEHIPTFDAEIEALRLHGVELTAWWFPTALNDEARLILNILERHKIKTQLWVTGASGSPKTPTEQKARLKAEAQRLRPIAEEAAKLGCTVGLYNHGGWFGEPENQIAIIEELKLPNVGIVYSLHHGHDHLDRFAELLPKMKPHLLALNLNGMVKDGERLGKKILPLGQGDLDLPLLKIISESGWCGPIGILNHTDEDAEARLLDNLEGLDWLAAQLAGQPPGNKPKPRSWREVPAGSGGVQILVAYYSLTGNTEQMANGVAEGAKRLTDAVVRVKKADDVSKQDLEWADAIVLGSPTYYGNIPGKFKAVLDDWSWKLNVNFTDKVGGAFATGGGQVGGKEHVVISLLIFMLNNRMVVAGPLYQNDATGSIWGELGAAAMTGPLDPGVGPGELDSARRLGERVARLAAKLRSQSAAISSRKE